VPCKTLSAEAFSDAKVVEASTALVCVFVDCAWGKNNRDLCAKYQVKSFPTVVFCDPDGNLLERMQSREAAALAAQMRKIVAMCGGDPTALPPPPGFPDYAARSLDDAKRASKPLAIYFYDDSPGSGSVHTALSEGLLKETLSKFYFTKLPLRRGAGDSAAYDVTRAPTILVLNPFLEYPALKPMARITGSRSARELKSELDAALRPGAAPAPPAAGAPDSSPPKPVLTKEDEALSDDEVDRQFIQASMVVAREWARKNKKPMAVAILEDIVKTYPKHVATAEARTFLAELLK